MKDPSVREKFISNQLDLSSSSDEESGMTTNVPFK